MYKVIHPFNFYKQGDVVDEATALKHGMQYFQKLPEPETIEIKIDTKGEVKEAKGKNKAITSKDIKTK